MKKTLAFLLAISMMLAMSSCGEVEGESSSEPAAGKEVASQEAEDTSAEESAEDADSTTEESAEDTSSEETVSSEADAESSSEVAESSETDSADSASSLEDSTFETPDGVIYSYAQLHADGFANKTADGIYYALVSEGGGAGHSFFKVWSTANGEWAEESQFQVANGSNYWFALDDGRLLRFYYQTPANEQYPEVDVLSFADGEINEIFNANTFSDLTFDDGSAIYENGTITFSAVYEGGYTFWLTFTGENGGVIDKEFTLDSEYFSIVDTTVEGSAE